MGNTKMTLVFCETSSIWNDFVSRSTQNNIFCHKEFLNALNVDYDLWMVEENGQFQAGAIILRENNEILSAPYPYTLYQGLIFAGHRDNFPSHRRTKWTIEIAETLLTGLSERYDRLSFCLHYTHDDLRAFQWFHYHEPELGQFRINMYYTGLISLTVPTDFETYLSTIRQTRRNLYRQAIAHGLTVEVSQDVDILDRLHRLTFARQGITLSDKSNSLARSIASAALNHGFGELLICRTTHGEPASATLLLYDEKCGYYLFGANDPAYHKFNSGTYLLLENIRRCQARGLKWVDVVGINSPQRGDFKTSCNAVPVPYFVVTWEKPQSPGSD
jgi:hypothetical protein